MSASTAEAAAGAATAATAATAAAAAAATALGASASATRSESAGDGATKIHVSKGSLLRSNPIVPTTVATP